MENQKIVYCPNCGSYRLEGAVNSKPLINFSLNPLQRNVKTIFQKGLIGAIPALAKNAIEPYRVHKNWVCQNCGYTFEM